MRTRWKALTAAAIAAALVIAPLTMSAASAHTGDLHAKASCDTGTGTYTVTYTLELTNVPAGRVGATKWLVGDANFAGTPTSAAGMTGLSIPSTGSQTITLGTSTLPGDTVGNGPWVYAFTTWNDGGGGTISKGSDGRIEGLDGDCEPPKKVFVCKYVGTPGVNERLQEGGNPLNPAVESIKGNFPEGHVIAVGDTFTDGHGRSVVIALDTGQTDPTIKDCAPPAPDVVKPKPPVVKDECETANDHYGLPEATGGIVYSRSGRDLVATLVSAQYKFDLTGTGWVINQNGTATYPFDADDFTDNESCDPDVYPVPGFFNADAPAPTCADAAVFVTPAELLAEGEVISSSESVTGYAFENVDVWIWRNEPGEVRIEIYAHDGYTLDELSDAWEVNGEDTFATRTIVLAAATGYQSGDPQVECYLVPQPAAPTFNDACGSAIDFDVPANTDEFEYVVAEEGATVTVTAVLLNEGDEWGEDVVTAWSHTFTDVACPTGATPPPATPAALPATGGVDMTPWGMGGAAMLLAGAAALLMTRRLARR